MDAVASRDLRNHTADVLRRVSAGGVVAVTVRGEVVAELHPPADARPRSWRRAELAAGLATVQADPGLRDDLRALAGETTDDLDPLT
jgi:prevent-host-death family protein